MKNINLKKTAIIFSAVFAFIFISAGIARADICRYPDCMINDPVSGSLYSNVSSVNTGESFTITITGQDDNGLSSFALYYRGSWNQQSIYANSGTKSWIITENNPGTYSFCGKVVGFNPNEQSAVGRVFGFSGTEDAPTSPNCVSVTVYCSSPNCGNYSYPNSYQYPSRACTGNTSCGLGVCASNQRPVWYYSNNGVCTYQCIIDYSCIPAAPACECSSGSCCDGCRYKTATNICNYQIQNEYACPWGQACGIGVGQRTNTRYQYCSGNSAQCTGSWGNYILGGWSVSEYCSANEACIVGNSQCQSSSKCVAKPAVAPAPIQTASKECNLGIGVSILGKAGASNDWVKDFTVNPSENLNFLMVLTNCGDKEVQDANLKAEIPKEIVYKGNLKIDGVSASGDITSGINIDKIVSGAIKTISFTGQSQTTNLIRTGSGQGNVVATITLTDGSLKSDSIKIAFASSRNTAAVSSSLFQFLVTKWYFWVLFIMVVLFLIYNIFKRFFMERSK